MVAAMVFASAGFLQAKTFVLPHILDSTGSVAANSPYAYDTTIWATYTGGLANVPAGGGATIHVYLYDLTGGALLKNNGTNICGPCDIPVGGTAPRKVKVAMDALISATGAWDSTVKAGFALVTVDGADPDGVNLQALIINTHTNNLDLSVFGFEPQPVASAPQ